jgi:ABC-type branched-subunit amino acid transport system substrate-binding protein
MLAAIVLSLSLLLLQACGDDDDNGGNGGAKIKIGMLTSFSGVQEARGKSRRNSAQLAVDEVNAAGGVNGKQFELVSADTKSETATALAEAKKLIADGVVVIIGPANSGESLELVKNLGGEGTPIIAPSATSPELTTADTGGVFWRTAISDAAQGKLAGEYVKNDLGQDTAGVLYVDNTYGSGLKDEFKKAYEAAGGSVKAEVKYPRLSDEELATKDFSTEVTELIKDQPKLIFLVTYPKDGAKITTALKAALGGGYAPKLFGCDANKSADFFTNADPTLITGMQGTAPGLAPGDADYAAFVTAYKAKNTTDPETYSENTYDATSLAIYAMAKGGVTGTTEEIRKGIMANLKAVSTSPGDAVKLNDWANGLKLIKDGKDIDYKGPSGPIEWDDNGDVTKASYIIWEVQDEGGTLTAKTLKATDLEL